eukprot:GGOE01019138.1.p1 GENE.GGOE01019138.1~~GGOE01019138.1.p1  ORF type:complete len:587 (-),score=255.76 GGOE01019138.1:373-2016(-)
MVGMVYSRSNILSKEVFLLDLLHNDTRERMPHLKCIVFIRPTTENMGDLCKELRKPRYGEYHVFFSNIVSRDALSSMALADEEERVKEVQEFYGDFYAVNNDLFTLNIPSCAPLTRGHWDQKLFDRMTAGILAVLLAMKRRPIIRYQASSTLCDRLASSVKDGIRQEGALFDFRQKDSCLLLLIDRKEDAVTPILTQWTYQAMIHELFGIHNNRVIIGSSKKKPDADDEVVLSCEQDRFFQKNMFSNWGDLCMRLKQFVDEFKTKSDQTSNIQSIEEMKNFMRDYPDFRKMSGNVSKHVTLVSEMSEKIVDRDLLEISVLEQEMACYDDHKAHYPKLVSLLQSPKTKEFDCLRLALLYVLRYEKDKGNAKEEVRRLLLAKGLSQDALGMLDTITKYGGAEQRQVGLFHKEGIGKVVINLARGFKDVTNVYTQHEPPLRNILEKVIKADLRESQFPYVPEFSPVGSSKWKPKEIIVFIVGGATYEEALFVNALNDPTNSNNSANSMQEASPLLLRQKKVQDVHCLLGSNCMLTAASFLKEVESVFQSS